MSTRIDEIAEDIGAWWRAHRKTVLIWGLGFVAVAEQLGWIPTPIATKIRDMAVIVETLDARTKGISESVAQQATAQQVEAVKPQHVDLVSERSALSSLREQNADLTARLAQCQSPSATRAAIDAAVNQAAQNSYTQAKAEMEAQYAEKVAKDRERLEAVHSQLLRVCPGVGSLLSDQQAVGSGP